MKKTIKAKLAALALAFTAAVPSLRAQLTLPTTDVSDGVLNVTGVTNIDLRNAVTVNNWTNSNTPVNAGNGVYDPAQWAVVFKYSAVNIASNGTVNFINNITHAPVVWVVNGNVTINGTVNLDGLAGNNTDPNNLTEPGPGGFRGGGGVTFGNGPGFGPGGGASQNVAGNYSGIYGNAQILPLIGGSGGAGYNGWNGCSGGGAILIAASGNMNLTNANLHATGGYNGCCSYGGAGSGGAIRLVAYQISGNGSTSITALGGGPNGAVPYVGRIRLEANSVLGLFSPNPYTAAVAPDSPVVKVFPVTNAPTVTILNVGLTPVSADPKAIMSSGVNADDVTLITTNTVTVQLQTQNFPTNGTVSVYIKPRNNNSSQTIIPATLDSGTTNLALWHVSTTLLYPGIPAHTIIQARASF